MHKRMIAILCRTVPAVGRAGGGHCGWRWGVGAATY